MSKWKGDCWAKWRYCNKSVCPKLTAKETQFTTCEWFHSDISSPTGFKWILPDPVLENVEPPVPLFKKFFTDSIMKFICEESIRYAISKGNHSFTIDTNTLKAFIVILLVRGYVDLPRQPMYWEHNEDNHNTTVSSLLSRNRFDETMQNLHLADNSSLDKEGETTHWWIKWTMPCKLLARAISHHRWIHGTILWSPQL